ncbi:hypothetical protein GPECTOR_38g368 [Gonium pectorale]|uniref:Uncharacterized protein n=1 Tax=Gonium pectorale TaxID=33097 RepID=A0A150GCS0_GONPE|nr:hypothetical protein GPECTOR_38g368 [Gonium pectorale]|eukprot:KXZ47130.1 hypothetical protein GPECTOR_38g368 [Gonium pectorale]
MEEMLRGITAGSAAASNPLLRSLLGPSASAADLEAAAKEAEAVWTQLDSLAGSDPDAYRKFVADAAAAARQEAEAARDPHVEHLAPALVLEAEAQAPVAAPTGAPAGVGAGPMAAGAAAPVVVVGGPKAVARVHVWAANDASGVKPPALAGGVPLSPAAAAATPAPGGGGGGSWSGVSLPIAEYRPATTRPGPVPVHHFHVAVHVSAVRMVVSGRPAAFRAVFLEGVSQYVEAEYRLALSRSVRTLQVHREVPTEEELKALVAADEAALARAAAAAAAGPVAIPAAGAADGEAAGDSALPQGLLQQLRTLATPSGPGPTGAPKQPGQQPAGGKGGAGVGAVKPKKPLIEELD